MIISEGMTNNNVLRLLLLIICIYLILDTFKIISRLRYASVFFWSILQSNFPFYLKFIQIYKTYFFFKTSLRSRFHIVTRLIENYCELCHSFTSNITNVDPLFKKFRTLIFDLIHKI